MKEHFEEIVVRVPAYAEAQIERGDTLHPVKGVHRIVDTRVMQVVDDNIDAGYVLALDGDMPITMTSAFFNAFATPVPLPPKPRKRKADDTPASAANVPDRIVEEIGHGDGESAGRGETSPED